MICTKTTDRASIFYAVPPLEDVVMIYKKQTLKYLSKIKIYPFSIIQTIVPILKLLYL